MYFPTLVVTPGILIRENEHMLHEIIIMLLLRFRTHFEIPEGTIDYHDP